MKGTPIDATFFSTSNGFTENSEAIWINPLPYLKSVESPWDKNSPKFSGQKVIPIEEFESKLGVKLAEYWKYWRSNRIYSRETRRKSGH